MTPKQAILLSIVTFLMASSPKTAAGISCKEVYSAVSGCLEYVKHGGTVPPVCCSGVKQLNDRTRSTPDRQQTCKCLKSIANSFPGINEGFIGEIPAKCGVDVGYPISRSVDCSK